MYVKKWKSRRLHKGSNLGDTSQDSYVLLERNWYNEKCLQEFILYNICLKGVLFCGGGFSFKKCQENSELSAKEEQEESRM
jgi:hypothetical protein